MDRFQDEYCRRYGRGALALGAGVELVALRAVGRGRTVRAELARSAAPAAGKVAGRRRLWTRIDGHMQQVDVDVTFVEELRPGDRLEGPILLDGADTTIWIPARARARVDEYRTIDIEVDS
jgi:N-methylhydantoinase A